MLVWANWAASTGLSLQIEISDGAQLLLLYPRDSVQNPSEILCSLVRFKFTSGPRYFFKKDFSAIGGFCFFHLIFLRRATSLVKSDGSSAASGRFPSNKIVMRRISTNWWFRVKPAFINCHIKSIGLLSIVTSILMELLELRESKLWTLLIVNRPAASEHHDS